jgi:hypothetical protein
MGRTFRIHVPFPARRSWVVTAAALALLLGGRAASARVVKAFPHGFLWGTAISGFQTEMGLGAPTDENSDWWVWVRDPQEIAAGHVSGELPEAGPGYYDRYATDHRNARYRLRNNALRLSLEWSRIFPGSTAAVDACRSGCTIRSPCATRSPPSSQRTDRCRRGWRAPAGSIRRSSTSS